jgi:hypothetical protein
MARILATCSFVLLLACTAFAQTEQQAAAEPAVKGSKGVADALRNMIPENTKTIPLAVTYENEATGEVIIKINAKNSGAAVPLADVSAPGATGSFSTCSTITPAIIPSAAMPAGYVISRLITTNHDSSCNQTF